MEWEIRIESMKQGPFSLVGQNFSWIEQVGHRLDQQGVRRRAGDLHSQLIHKNLPIGERMWTDVEPGAQSNQAYPVARRLNTLLRHGQLPREEDGAIEYWRLKDYLRNESALSILV